MTIYCQQYNQFYHDAGRTAAGGGIPENEVFFNEADYIFEGIASDCKCYLNDDKTKVFTSCVMTITKIYKGWDKLKLGTVEFIIEGGVVQTDSITTESGFPMPFAYRHRPHDNVGIPWRKAIYFSLETKKFPPSKRNNTFDNPQQLKYFYEQNWSTLIYPDHDLDPRYVWGLRDLNINSKSEFLHYILKFKGLRIPDNEMVPDDFRLYDNDKTNYLYDHEKFMQCQLQMAQMAKKRKDEARRQHPFFIDTTLKWEIQNQQLTLNGNQYYYEFDVMVSANTYGTYYSNAFARLNFNTNAFGSNLVANNNILIDIDPAFSSTTYYVHKADISAGCVQLGLHAYESQVTSWNRTQLTPTPKRMLHVKIETPTGLNNIPANLQFAETTFTSDFSCYTLSPNAHWIDIFSYDNTYYYDPSVFNISTNAPLIFSYAPVNLRAGNNEILTITGANFGATKGKVLFRDADYLKSGHPDYFLPGLEDTNIVSWSNTEIKVKVPSMVKDGFTIPDLWGCAGSGDFKVKTAGNVEVQSPAANPLQIEYSWLNYFEIPTYPNNDKMYLAKTTCVNGILFNLHTSLQGSAYSQARATIEKACIEWTAKLSSKGVVVALEKDASGNYIYNSNINAVNKNVIYMDATFTGAMNTTANPTYDPGNQKYFRFNSDIQINPNPIAP